MAILTIANVNGWPVAFYNALKQHKITGSMQLNGNGTVEFIIDDNDAAQALNIWNREIVKR